MFVGCNPTNIPHSTVLMEKIAIIRVPAIDLSGSFICSRVSRFVAKFIIPEINPTKLVPHNIVILLPGFVIDHLRFLWLALC